MRSEASAKYAGTRANALNDAPKLFFGELVKKRSIAGTVERAWPIVFFLGAENIGGAAIAGKQI